ncbi:hypothetical protein N0V83_006976 [Neocucurbitaria cava]|uniref:RRM domain-containing protein n=1 Tax=Neocucurbitaria cava TaxID=798079 RepID=A0A9W9CKL9_9PLEO|nr:hypothetical protein N0V83_006976 [Neocucurbitaria cava]
MSNQSVDDFIAEHDAAFVASLNDADTHKDKRKDGPESEVKNDVTKKSKGQEKPKSEKTKVQENRAIYVTNLPLDTNESEINEVFKKFGIIDKGADGEPRIKMYTNDEGDFNGEALIVYFKKDSIDLAIQMMDDYFFRIEEQNQGTIRVKEADFSYKRNKDGDQIASKLTRKDKKAAERNRADLNRKLAEWSDNEEEVAETFAPKKNKWAKVVIVKYAFTLEELDEDEEAYLDIKDDMRSEAEKHGSVTNVTLFDKEEAGIVTVRFREFEAAEMFRNVVHGKNYAYRKLEATIAEDKPRFKKSARGEEPDSEEEERLEKLAKKE